jgi:hypothetical protein
MSLRQQTAIVCILAFLSASSSPVSARDNGGKASSGAQSVKTGPSKSSTETGNPGGMGLSGQGIRWGGTSGAVSGAGQRPSCLDKVTGCSR